MAVVRRSFLRELSTLINSLDEEFHGQVRLISIEESNSKCFSIEVTPNRGLYAHASFIFIVDCRSGYPDKSPSINCISSIFHPNVGDGWGGNNLCINILSSWSRRYGLPDLIHSILFLLYEPNFSDPINQDAAVIPDGMTLENCIHLALSGGSINGVTYHPNRSWCQWACEQGLLPLNIDSKNYVERTGPVDRNDEGENACLPDLQGTTETDNWTTENQDTKSYRTFIPAPVAQASLQRPSVSRLSNVDSIIVNLQNISSSCWLYFHIWHVTVNRLHVYRENNGRPWTNCVRYYFADIHNALNYYLGDSLVTGRIILAQGVSNEGQEWLGLEQTSTVKQLDFSVNDTTHENDDDGDEDGEEGEDDGDGDEEDNDSDGDDDYGSDDGDDTQDRNDGDDTQDRNDGDDTQDRNEQSEDSWRANCCNQEDEVADENWRKDVSESAGGLIRGSPSQSERDCQLDTTELTGLRKTKTGRGGCAFNENQGDIRHEDGQCIDYPGHGQPRCSSAIAITANTDTQAAMEMASDLNEETNEIVASVQEVIECISCPVTENIFSESQVFSNGTAADESSGTDICSGNKLLSHREKINITNRLLGCLSPWWWSFYLTRWPPFLSPGRAISRSNFKNLFGNYSHSHPAFRMVAFLSSLEFQAERFRFILLVDQLVLSPISPIFNHIVQVPQCFLDVVAENDNHWLSLEWCSLVDLFSFRTHRTPPVRPYSSLSAAESPVSSSPPSRRLFPPAWKLVLTPVCLLSNWLAYLSRLELTHSCLGPSPPVNRLLSEPAGVSCVTATSLTCGQTPLLDGWPLWLATQLLRGVIGPLLLRGLHLTGVYPHSRSDRYLPPRLAFLFCDIDQP